VKILMLILPLFLLGAQCSKCDLNKMQMRCEYYVGLKGDMSKTSYCESYADYLDETKVYGKASWYHLLAKNPEKAIQSAKKALKFGEEYAKEYMAIGYMVTGDKKKAKELFGSISPNPIVDKDFETVKRIYNDFNIEEAKSFLKK